MNIDPIYPQIFKFKPYVLFLKDFQYKTFRDFLCFQIVLTRSIFELEKCFFLNRSEFMFSVSYGKTSGVLIGGASEANRGYVLAHYARPANNSHLSGILAEFTKKFFEVQLLRINFPFNFWKNVVYFSSILIVLQKMLENSVRYRGKSKIFFAILKKWSISDKNVLPAQIFSGN